MACFWLSGEGEKSDWHINQFFGQPNKLLLIDIMSMN